MDAREGLSEPRGAAAKVARARLDLATVAAFALCVAAPAADLVARPVQARLPDAERRAAAPMPPLPRTFEDLETFPRAFEARFLDTFGLRDVLLGASSLVQLEVFHRSPVKRALLGRDSWMFLVRAQTGLDMRGLAPLSRAELDGVCGGLEARRAKLAKRGIAYLAVVVPNKETIYREQLPASVDKVGPTRLEQLAQRLEERRFDTWLDLREALATAARTEREREPVYEPLGTHWSPRGALVAYRAIVERARELVPSLAPEPGLALVAAPELDDSYARTMYLAWRYPSAPKCWRPSQTRARVRTERRRRGAGSARVTVVDDARLPRGLLLHDSFGPYVEAALAEHFSHLVCAWTHDLDDALLDGARPDVVIDMIVERRIAAWFARGAVDDE